MTDATAPADPTPGATPAPAPPATPATTASAGGHVGKVRNPWAVIGLSIITLGIYTLYWWYVTFEDTKLRNGQGIGGVIGLILGFVFVIVNVFLLPSEVANMYVKAGKTSPVKAVTGFWTFIPLIGFIIWVIKVQGAMNRVWEGTY